MNGSEEGYNLIFIIYNLLPHIEWACMRNAHTIKSIYSTFHEELKNIINEQN